MIRALRILTGFLGLSLLAATAAAQSAPWRRVQAADGSLHVIADGVRHRITPAPISDGELAAVPEGEAWGATFMASAPPASAPPPAPAPESPPPVVLEGRGKTATAPVTPPSALSVATFVHEGDRNFIVRSFRGDRSTLLVNTIGGYRGQRPIAGAEPLTFDIEADGRWTLRLEPIGRGGSPPFSGRGDAVSALFDPPATGPWEISHDGRRNFIVELHCAGGSSLVQNSIGPLQASGVVQFRQGPCFWEVQADGAWGLTPR